MSLSRRVSEIDGDYSRKSQNISTPCICAPAEGIPLELGTGAGSQKLEWWSYRADKEVWRLASAVWTECTNVTDRPTDRKKPGDSKDRAYA